MPKQIDEISDFLDTARRKGAKTSPPRTIASPFYPGMTKYGGASARRVDIFSSSPYNLNQRKTAPVIRVRANATVTQNLGPEEKMSTAARRILESIERVSSPYQESKKMLLRGKAPSSYYGPTRISDRLNISQGLHTVIGRVPQFEIGNSLTGSQLGGGGKIKTAKSSGRVPLNRDRSEYVILPEVKLVAPKILPSFNFAPEKRNVENEQENVVKSYDFPTAPSLHDWKFPSPAVRSRDEQPLADIAFKFSLPEAYKHLSSESLKSTNEPPITQESWGNKFKPPSGSWECPVCMINNNTDSLRCVACEESRP